MRRMTKTLIIILGAYLLVCAGAYFFQRKLIFIPSRGPVPNPAKLGIEADKLLITPKDGPTLSAWWASGDRSPYTLIWCHGNAGNILHRAEEFADFIEAGFNVLLFDYRGYGDSEGAPSAAGIKEDVLAVYDHLIAQGVTKDRIVPYGRSVGSGPAVHLANQRQVAGLILVQPLTSTLAMGKRSFPFLPVKLLLREILDNEAELSKYEGPLLILHGDADEIVPFEMGKRLFEIAPGEKKNFVPLRGGDHNNLGRTHSRQILEAVRNFLESLSS